MFKCISVLLLPTISSDHHQKQEQEGLLKFFRSQCCYEY